MPSRFILFTAAIVVAVAAANIAGCGSSDAKTALANPAAKPALSVRVETVTPRSMTDVLTVTGIVKAFEDVMISPEEGGVVKTWRVEKGRVVAAGQLLVALKDEVIKASYEAADAQYKMSKLNVDRQEKVFAEQGISEVQYLNLQYGRDAAKANADLMKARWDRTQIKSPVAGVLDEQYFDEGEFAPPGVPIAHVVSIGKLKVSAEVPERHAGTVMTGTPASIAFDAFPTDTIRGTVGFVGSTVNASNRSLTVEVVIVNPNGRLKPEMIGKVRLLRAAKQNALLVSETSIQLVDRDRYVVFVESDGKAEERTVILGSRQNKQIEILSGLRAGDRVISTDLQKLTNGISVSVAN